MSDISVTASAVVATSTTTTAIGSSSAAITAGQPLYFNTSGLLTPTNASTSAAAAACVGVALNNAPGANQPVTYANGGDVTFNAVLTAGTIYVVSGAAGGGIAPSADLDSGTTWYATILGVATSTTNLRLSIKASGVINA